MSYADFEKNLMPEVTSEQREMMKTFYDTHPFNMVTVDEVPWSYIASGTGEEAVLILVGGARYGDSAFNMISALEDSFRVIAPSYPPVKTISDLVKGIVAILSKEGISRVHVIGTAFGGAVAQYFLMAHPEMVDRLVLANTGGNYPEGYENVIQGSINRIRFMPMFMLRPVYRRAMLEDLYDFTEDVREFWRAFLTSLVTRESKKELMALYACIQDAAVNTISVENLPWEGKVFIIDSSKKSDLETNRQDVKELYPKAKVYTYQGEAAMSVFIRTEEYEKMVKEFLLEKETGEE